MDYDKVLRAMLDRYPEADEDQVVDFLCDNMVEETITADEFKRLCEDFECFLDAE